MRHRGQAGLFRGGRACTVSSALARLALTLGCVGVGVLGALLLSPSATVRAAVTQPALPATLSLQSASVPIPRSFFGLSVEYNELPTYEAEGATFDRLISLIHPEDGSHMLIRLGGKSADHFWWNATANPLPRGVFMLDQAWINQFATLVDQEHLQVMLDLNLAVHSSTMAVQFANAVKRALPANSLVGLEIGNEPDEYWRQPWLAKQVISSSSRNLGPNWTVNYNATDYRRDYSLYAHALNQSFPGLPLGGPDIISAKPQWLSAVENLGPEDPAFLTIHRYASSNCWPVDSPWYPTISRLLNTAASAGLARTVLGAVAFAHERNQQLRLTEVNSISCGGNTGVADSFATALWAPDTLFSMVEAGANGVSWHIRPNQPNSPFHPTPTGIQPLPELYGLAMFSQMTRPGARIVASALTGPSALNLRAWVVRFPGGIRVLLINKGGRAANVTMKLGPAGAAYVKRLLAPAIGSATGVTFAGRTIGPDGRWHGKEVSPRIPSSGGIYHVTVPAYSAAMISAR
jgi:hypothetical protein